MNSWSRKSKGPLEPKKCIEQELKEKRVLSRKADNLASRAIGLAANLGFDIEYLERQLEESHGK
jgi:hypothetical protein